MPQPTLSSEQVGVYVSAVDWLSSILSHAAVIDAWSRPSVVARYTVGGVAAHAVHSVLWLEQVLKDAEPTGLRRVTVPEFMGLNRADDENDDPFGASLRSAAEEFAATGPHIVAAALAVARDELVTLLGAAPAARAVAVIRVVGASVPLSEYLPTRILEVVVHGDDVACSVAGLRAPDPPLGGVAAALEVCLELAQARVGGLEALRGFTRAERAKPDVLRVL